MSAFREAIGIMRRTAAWLLGAAAGAAVTAGLFLLLPRAGRTSEAAQEQAAPAEKSTAVMTPPGPEAAAEPPVSRENAVVRAVKRAAPAVVNISTEAVVRRRPPNPFMVDPFSRDFHEFFFGGGPRQELRQNLGSGFIFDPRGYILTNEHVIAQAVRVKVLLASGDEVEAAIVGSDRELDLAVLRVDVKGRLPTLPLGSSADLMIGEDVIAIGNPFGLSHTVTRGVLSAFNRFLRIGERTYEHLLQTDAPINPGNSGGPLLNVLGEVIGVNSAIRGDAEGIGFAIPIDEAMRVAGDLVLQDQASPPWLGILGLQYLSPELRGALGYAEGPGLVAASIYSGSPAGKAGIQRGDILVRLDGEEIQSFSAFLRLLGRHKAGDKAKFTIFREGRQQVLEVALTEFPAEAAARLAWERLGFRGEPLTLAARVRLGLNVKDGLAVVDVRHAGPAHAAGMARGDVVTGINSFDITDETSFRTAVLRTLWHSSVMLRVARGEHVYLVPLTVAR